MLRALNCLLVGVLLALVVSGCRNAGPMKNSYVTLTKVSAEEVLPAEVVTLRVAVQAGAIAIVGADDGRIRVEAEIKIRRERAAKLTEPGAFADHVRLQATGTEIVVEDLHAGQPDGSDWQVHLTVRVPARLAVRSTMVAGSLSVEGMTGSLELRDMAGAVRVAGERLGPVSVDVDAGEVSLQIADLNGPLTASVNAGSVAVDLTPRVSTHDVTLKANTGAVSLALPAEAPGTFQASASIGQVTIRNRPGVTVKRAGLGATAAGTIGDGGPRYELTTGIGEVSLR